MTAQLSIVEKATNYAREVSENSLVFVCERHGVYWLSIKTDCKVGWRSLMAVGFVGVGIRRIRESIKEYFEGK